MAACICASSATSATNGVAPGPSSAMPCCSVPASTSTASTFAPSLTKSLVAARPIPEAAPVITATLPDNLVNFAPFPTVRLLAPVHAEIAHSRREGIDDVSATVNHDRGAGYERRIVPSQEGNDSRDFRGGRHPAQRHVFRQPPVNIVEIGAQGIRHRGEDVVQHLGLYRSRTDNVAADLVLAVVEGHLLGKVDETGLGGAVRGRAGHTSHPRKGRYV